MPRSVSSPRESHSTQFLAASRVSQLVLSLVREVEHELSDNRGVGAGTCTALIEMHLSANFLKDVPREIGGLVAMKVPSSLTPAQPSGSSLKHVKGFCLEAKAIIWP